MQFLHQKFNVSALLLDDALKPSAEGRPKQRQVCSYQCVTVRRTAAGSRSSAGILHGCQVVDRHGEHVDSNIRC